MTEITQHPLGEGIHFWSIYNPYFKTVRISVHFILPLEKEKAAARTLLPFVMCRSSKEYPDFTKLSQRLAELYGADLHADTQKVGDTHVISLTVSSLADRYTLNQEHLALELTRLLCSVIFDPPWDAEHCFSQENFHQEQRQALEMIDAEYNDKRMYAKQRCEQIMFSSEQYGIPRYGSREDIENLQRPQLTEAWEELLQRSKIEIMVLGDCQADTLQEEMVKAFGQIKNRRPAVCETRIVLKAQEERDISETMAVAQSKLVMGFRTGTLLDTEEEIAARLMTTVLGGTPHAKLFLQVREALSLCYYCSARYYAMKGFMLVESGVETRNIERAKQEILAQLEEIQKGNVTEEELVSAKLSLCNSYRTVEDYLSGMESWYLLQTFRKTSQTPEEAVQQIQKVTKEQVIAAANRVTLDTTYRLVGSEEEQR